MMQFLAILKDSFREAVDGFVIYLMLVLSALLIVLLGSVSYTPEEPVDALPRVLRTFQIIFPDKGGSTAPTGVPVQYALKATDVQSAGGGAKFTLEIDPRTYSTKKDKDGKDVLDADGKPEQIGELPKKGTDGFRYSVYAWRQPAGQRLANPFKDGRNKNKSAQAKGEIEIVMPPPAGPAELETVSEADMADFIKYQFATFVGINDVKVTRRPGVAEPEYKFDVEIAGISGARGWPHAIHVFFGAVPPLKGVPLGQALYFIQDFIVNGLGAAVTLMLSVVITAFFIPNMLRKGSVDLLISKPIGRSQLLIYKYVGGLTFIFLLSSFTIGGVWLVMAIRSGSWDPSFLLVIPVLTFTFGILYSVSTVVAVFTRSAIAAILVTLGFMLAMYLFGQFKSFTDMNKIANVVEMPEWVYTVVDGLNNVLPRYKDLDRLTTKLVVDSTMTKGEARLQGIFTEYPSWGGAIGVSLGFIAVMLGLSCWRFTKRDY
jgi:ABC-type transport system involved in multi-copper enzyme maturation permease subunit